MHKQQITFKRQVKTANHLFHSQPLLSLSHSQEKIIKTIPDTEKKLKQNHKIRINNYYSKSPQEILQLTLINRTINQKYNQKVCPNLEEKSEIQRVKWFIQQQQQVELQNKTIESLKLTRETFSRTTMRLSNDEINQKTPKHQDELFNKYFVLNSRIKQIKFKEKIISKSKISESLQDLKYKNKQKQQNQSLAEFFQRNSELKRHFQTLEERNEKSSLFHQLNLQSVKHIDLYSSMKKGQRNEELHQEYKDGLKQQFELDDSLNSEEISYKIDLERKGIFRNPLLKIAKKENQLISIQQNQDNLKLIELSNISNNKETNQLLNQISERRKHKYKRIISQLITYLYWMNEHQLQYKDISGDNVYQKIPFQSYRSKLCFQYVKQNQLDLTKSMINADRFLVYDFDHFKQTLLHHAVIRNYPEIAEFILKNYGEVNYKDISGRTPLYYAIRSGCNECVRVLLFHKASPWSNEKNNYDKYLDMLDPKVRDVYKKAKTVQYKQSLDSLKDVDFTCFKIIKILGYLEFIIQLQFILMIILLPILFILITCHQWSEDTNVRILTESEYDQLDKSKSIFIMFYAPWCPHCVKLMPTWELQAEHSNVAAVNCEENKRFCQRFQIKGFPSLIYLPENTLDIGYKFQGPRTNDEFDTFIQGGWQKEGVLQIQIKSEFTLMDEIISFATNAPALAVGVVALTIITLLVIYCNCTEQKKVQPKNNQSSQQQQQKKRE